MQSSNGLCLLGATACIWLYCQYCSNEARQDWNIYNFSSDALTLMYHSPIVIIEIEETCSYCCMLPAKDWKVWISFGICTSFETLHSCSSMCVYGWSKLPVYAWNSVKEDDLMDFQWVDGCNVAVWRVTVITVYDQHISSWIEDH